MIFEICNEHWNRELFMFFYSNIEIDDVRDNKWNNVVVIA